MVGMIGMVAMLKVEATGIGRARPPHPCLACHRHQVPVLQRTRRPAVLDAVRAAEVITAVDPAGSSCAIKLCGVICGATVGLPNLIFNLRGACGDPD